MKIYGVVGAGGLGRQVMPLARPPGGLGTRLDAMYEFHAQRGIRPQRGHGKHNAGALFGGALRMQT